MRYRLARTQCFSKPIREVFSFFERPENLAMITPPWLGFTILTPSPIVMKEEALLDYFIRLFGVRVHWTTRILRYQPPYSFVDTQIQGPYKTWIHTHTFVEKDGGTLMTDDVLYDPGWGLIGWLAYHLFVRRSVEEIFDYRARFMERHFRPAS